MPTPRLKAPAFAVVILTAGIALAGEGGRDPADIAAVVEQHMAEITNVYDTFLETGLAIEGTVLVKFTIARTGAVTASEVAEATTGCELFEEAVAAAVAKWDFGPSDGDAVTVRYPFSFAISEKNGY
ncbi:MAG: TonB family protein [candidate division Zixibacteria bacterium]|nr:TonB family protein [candidate division Zixibacteria bacterium]